ncbi:KAT8 regulatory NSL complex subunit 1-like protein isoform X1 [Apus apus]|uniref:KAT8 regulatory NSL complex subunit 1-like protein isoform X1 n=2 Tax=Apus apus TaxID=8895 RepID=UPI0021F8E623|nr:KAT8 regulatory NSL complex subunit 1-like protein isoform X1 [Apus apus]XP_051479935.1 KAT8 regulatory NSL complex subunit 1-like protein isoform X1 [Apus apus]XP_051479936.1 KAT8 regulatory NSL complex subunit 1-like protein isoform X1 [Apus apus]
MTPALREAATKGHGIHLSPSLSSRAMESDTALCMENSRAVEEKIKEDSIAQITCSVLGFPTAEPKLRNDIFSVQHFGSPPSSRRYQSVLLMSRNSAFSNRTSKQTKAGEPDCSRMRNSLHNGADTSFGLISHSEPGEQVKGETFPETTSLSLAETRRLPNVTESGNAEEMQLLNGKWYKKNVFLGRALEACAESIKGDLLHQILHRPSEGLLSCTREEVYARLLQYVTKQQMEISRAKRIQKRLQMLLAKHVIKHCDQQLKCFVKHQLQRMKVFHEPTRFSSSSSLRCTEGWPENNATTLESSSSTDVQNGVSIAPGEILGFALSTGGLLSRVEKDLDSDATCSSSDEDGEEQTVRTTVEASYTSEWKWLAERARIGSRWTWLQAQISELEYKIQQLTDLHRQIRATKGMVILEEFPFPKDILKKQIQLTDREALLNATGNSQAAIERQDSLPEHDFEMSPSSPTLLLRNIEKQSAQLSEIISSLIAPLNLSPSSSSLSSKTCRHRQLVNGISFRASDNREVSSSSSWLLDHQHIKKRRRDRTRLRSLPVSNVSTSARTRPLRSFQKRKLYRMHGACYWSQQALPSRDASFPYKTQLPCVVPASTFSSSEYSTESKILDYVQELDSSFHPVLSFPSDIPLHIYFETLLRNDDIKGEPVDTSSLGVEFKVSPDNDCNQHNLSAKQWSSGCLSNSKSQSVSGTSDQLLEGRKKRHLSETAVGERNARLETFSFQHAEPESQSSFAAVTNVSAMSRPTHSTSSQHNSRRRLRSESSYDIDNIVIPMSLVAPSKLEKLQYKEILTPSWRVVELQPLEGSHTDEEEIEDLSDEAFSLRHTKYEERERARWSLWEQSRWPRRNSRSYSKNADGRHSQDAVQKDPHGPSCASLHGAAEPLPDLAVEAHSSVCSGIAHLCRETQEAKSGLWERRVFPLKDEEVEALLCQDQITNPTEMSSAAFPSDSLCTSCTPVGLPDSGHLPGKQSAEESEDCENVCLGISNTRKQR